VLGNTRAGDILMLAHTTLWGSPDDQGMWKALDEYLLRRPCAAATRPPRAHRTALLRTEPVVNQVTW
jgi:hypothetical protein